MGLRSTRLHLRLLLRPRIWSVAKGENLLTQASLFSRRNIYQQWLKPSASDRELVIVTRVAVIIFAVIAAVLAYVAPAQLVYLLLVGYAGIIQMFPGWVLGTIWKWITREGVLAGLVVGETVAVLTTFVRRSPLGIHSIVWGLVFNLPIALAISKLTYKGEKA